MRTYNTEQLGIREMSDMTPQADTRLLTLVGVERPILRYMQQSRSERAQLFQRVLLIDRELPPVYPPPGRALPKEFYGEGEK